MPSIPALLRVLLVILSLSGVAHAQVTAVVATPGGLAPPLENPSMGMNLNGVDDWTTQQPFLNIAKTMRPMIGHMPGRWGGLSHGDLRQGGWLDRGGWPTAIPPEAEALGTVFLTEQPAEATRMAGRYRLTFTGTADVELRHVRLIRQQANEIWFDYAPTGRNLVELRIKAMDPNDPLRDLVVVHERNIPLYEAGAVFNPDFLARVADFRLLRFMEWQRINGSAQVTWEDRPRTGDFSYVPGVPLPVMLALANEVGADAWLNIPHMADDAYVEAFAKAVRDGLHPSLKAYAEYSNEVWNGAFPQAGWARDQAQALWGRRAGGDAWMQYAGLRAAQVADIWTRVYGADAEARLVRVVAVHTAWLGLEEALLNGRLFRQDRAALPDRLFDAYAVTGYFRLSMSEDRFLPEMTALMAKAEAHPAGQDHLFDLLAQDVRGTSLARRLTEWLPYHAAVAADYDMELIAYEGGSHVMPPWGANQNEEINQALVAFNYSPQMDALYLELLAGWEALGGTLFAAYSDIRTPTKWGSFGHLRHLQDQTGRWDILMAHNRRMGPVNGNRAPGTFLHGVTLTGTDRGETLEGTPQADTLLGGAGDDILSGLGGSDRLHGGAGEDIALLPGRWQDHGFSPDGPRVRASSLVGEVLLRDIEYVMFAEEPGFILATSDLVTP